MSKGHRAMSKILIFFNESHRLGYQTRSNFEGLYKAVWGFDLRRRQDRAAVGKVEKFRNFYFDGCTTIESNQSQVSLQQV